MADPRPLTTDERVRIKTCQDEMQRDAITWYLQPGDANLETLRLSTGKYVEALKESIAPRSSEGAAP